MRSLRWWSRAAGERRTINLAEGCDSRRAGLILALDVRARKETHMAKKATTSRAKGRLTRKSARKAAKAAKKAYSKSSSRPTSWKKGGREWSRVLGHFGASKAD
jgi:hypothetical protein